eukprot:Skav215451  [mRNA]  locus=scaffold2193:104466:105188:- [translate_table: standard]
MPPPESTCNRCREVAAAPGDSWCVACSAWEGLGRELAGHWDSPGCRLIASDLILNVARQVRALRSLGAGLSRAPPDAGENRAPAAAPKHKVDTRPSLPRRTSVGKAAKAEIAQEEDEEESFEEEEEEEPVEPTHRPLGGGERKPPEPPHPPPGKKRPIERTKEHSHHRERSRHRHHRDHKESHRHQGGRHRGSKRGGRKHQRLHRLATNPWLKIHRKPPAIFWNLSYSDSGRTQLDRSIL